MWLWLGVAWAGGTPAVEWSLPSGLVVLHQPDTRFPIVRVVTLVQAGTADTGPGKRDLAHLVEHLAFRATVDGTPAMAALTAAGCEVNAFTALDHTVYHTECPSDATELALRFASQLATHRLPGLDAEQLRVESQVVLHESTQRSDRGWLTGDALTTAIFPPGHPYHVERADPEEVRGLTLADVEGFLTRHYTPDRVVLGVGGDIDAGRLARALAAAATDGLPHARWREGAVQTFAPADVGWLGVPEPVPWFVDPDAPGRALPRGAPSSLPDRSEPTPPAPSPEPTRIAVGGGLPLVAAVWFLPAADRVTWTETMGAERFGTIDVERAVDGMSAVLEAGCTASPGVRGSWLACFASVEDEESFDRVGEALVHAFDGPYSYNRDAAHLVADSEDEASWRRLMDTDSGGMDALVDLVRFRATTGAADLGAREAMSFGGGRGAAQWARTYAAWLPATRAALIFVEAEGRAASSAGSVYVGQAGVAARAWPAPALAGAEGPTLRQQRLTNGLEVVIAPVGGPELSAWRLGAPAPSGTEELGRFLADALITPMKVKGNALRYAWSIDPSPLGGVVGANQRGRWDPRHLVRSLWGTVQALRTTNLASAFHWEVVGEVYAGRDPETWRERLWRRELRENPENDGLPELDRVVTSPSRVARYLAAWWRPERANLVVAGRLDDAVGMRIIEEMEDWVPHGGTDTGLPVVVRRAPTPSVLLLDGAHGGRTAQVGWTCPTSAPATGAGRLATRALARVANDRLWTEVRESRGLTYTPSVHLERRWGGLDLVFDVSTELGLERATLDQVRAVARSLAARPATAAELARARRQVLSELLLAGGSTRALASSLSDQLAGSGAYAQVRTDREGLAALDAETLGRYAGSCGDVGVGAVIGDLETTRVSLVDLDLPVREVDWRAEHLAFVGRWAPGRLKRESAWVTRE